MTELFDDPAMVKLWNAYFSEFDKLSAPLEDEGRELRSDLERHVMESIGAQTATGNPAQQLKVALERLGRPIDYLHPMLGERYISRATRTYNPVAVGKGLFHTILAGGGRLLAASLFCLGYLFIAVFAVIALSKPFWADNVGLFRAPDGTIAAGIVAETAGHQEVLGWWSIPIALALAMLTYLLLTKGLGRLMRTQ